MQSICCRRTPWNRLSVLYSSWNVKQKHASALEPKEVQLPVPWGHVSGKAWGNPANKPVLALHGLLENAGSFDRLAPLLASDLYVVALDFPGHGLSSHRPRGMIHNVYQYATDVKYMVDGLKWNKFSLLGHSMGAGAASWFSGLMPNMVDRLVLLEEVGASAIPADDVVANMRHNLENLDKVNYKDTKTFPDIETIIERMVQAKLKADEHMEKEKDSLHVLCARGVKKLENGNCMLTRDAQLNLNPMPKATEEINLAFLKAIQCQILIILSDAPDTKRWKKVISDVKPHLCPGQVKVITIHGGHHFLLYTSHKISSPIRSFLL